MHPHVASLFASSSFDPALSIPLLAIAGAILIVFLSLYFAHERRRLWHDTARVALEKGQPLPPDLPSLGDRSCRRGDPRRDLRTGLILLAVSGGLYFGLRGVGDGPQLIGAYITGGIGVALLLNALLASLFPRKDPTADTARPPQT